jgi:formylglycine-generating enzyme required for sulfatase activity
MKLTLSIAVVLIFNFANAQLNLPKDALPGVLPIKGDYLFMAQGEVSNLDYREFINALNKQGNSKLALQMHPDTAVWDVGNLSFKPFVSHYFRHPAYNDFPVVGVTQAQATEYCKWLRTAILTYLQTKKHNKISDIIVRLPTAKEWRHAARGGQDKSAVYPWPGESIRITDGKKRDKGKIRLNALVKNQFELNEYSGGFITTPSYSYWPNGYGLYNMAGNVAEWTNIPGQALGGAWSQNPYFARINSQGFNGDQPAARRDIGFRYVIEIVSIKGDVPFIKKLTPKTIEKQFAKVDSVMFIGKYEVNNEWFNTFCMDGNMNFRPNDSLWKLHSPYAYRGIYSTYEGTSNFPVVNISYQAAVAYSLWLTKKYNAMPHRKYKKVEFNLPNEEEWQKAAQGKLTNIAYPWGGSYLRNSRGAFLANFFPIPESSIYQDPVSHKLTLLPIDTTEARMEDGLEFTGPVDSYFPNSVGAFNISGNAAEMLAEEGISLGGSWNSRADKLQLLHTTKGESENKSRTLEHFETYTGPSPTLGFRLVMKVLEY